MRNANLNEFGLRWYYWLFSSAFGAAGGTALFVSKGEAEDRLLLIGFGCFFSSISLLGFLWPILRTREKQGIRFASMRLGPDRYQGMLIPESRVKFLLLLIGGTIFGFVALAAAFVADSLENRAKGGIAFVFYFILGVRLLFGIKRNVRGLLLTREGVVWHEVFLQPLLIPWDQISQVRIYNHREQYSIAPSLGLRVINLDCLATTPKTKSKLQDNAKRHGWHLYRNAESLLLPLGLAETAINFYLIRDESREELATGAAFKRIDQFAANGQF